jgi:hypothetical protein
MNLPSDLLLHIASFLEYTPDTARLSRLNHRLNHVRQWYPRSGHRQPHNVTLVRGPDRGSVSPPSRRLVQRFQDGRAQRNYWKFDVGRLFLFTQLAGSSGMLLTFYFNGKKCYQQFFSLNDTVWIAFFDHGTGAMNRYQNQQTGLHIEKTGTGGIVVEFNSFRYLFSHRGELTGREKVNPARTRQDNNRIEYGPDWIKVGDRPRRRLTRREQRQLPTLFDFDMGMFTLEL